MLQKQCVWQPGGLVRYQRAPLSAIPRHPFGNGIPDHRQRIGPVDALQLDNGLTQGLGISALERWGLLGNVNGEFEPWKKRGRIPDRWNEPPQCVTHVTGSKYSISDAQVSQLFAQYGVGSIFFHGVTTNTISGQATWPSIS